MKQVDNYIERRAHLKDLTDEELFKRFWELAEKIVSPLLDMGYRYTTPAIERSVLLRMGFSSLEVKPIVDGAMQRSLMGKGCGNIVWRLAKEKNLSIRQAGLALSNGDEWDTVEKIFKKQGVES